jgi:hypothetical protein
MYADRQSATLATRAGLQASSDSFCLLDDAPGGIKEFLTRHGRPCSAVGAFEQCRTELMFKITEAATQCRLTNVQCLRRLPQASVLRHDDCPPHVLKFDSHRVPSLVQNGSQ